MGQKTHPLGFRLGITQEHKSKWYGRFNKYEDIKYANMLKEDNKIRLYLKSIAKKTGISNVIINRNQKNNKIELTIETGKPGILTEEFGVKLRSLSTNIKEFLPLNRKIDINLSEVEQVNLNASLLADLVVEQLEQRIAFRRAIRETLEHAKDKSVNGIKIQVSGRLNGAEMARSEWEGQSVDM